MVPGRPRGRGRPHRRALPAARDPVARPGAAHRVERARCRRHAHPRQRRGEPGTELTVEIARRLRKPVYTFHAGSPEDVGAFRRWLQVYRVRTLNVAGPRESESPGIYAAASALLRELLARAG